MTSLFNPHIYVLTEAKKFPVGTKVTIIKDHPFLKKIASTDPSPVQRWDLSKGDSFQIVRDMGGGYEVRTIKYRKMDSKTKEMEEKYGLGFPVAWLEKMVDLGIAKTS